MSPRKKKESSDATGRNSGVDVNSYLLDDEGMAPQDGNAKKYRCTCCGASYYRPVGRFFKNDHSPLFRANDGFTNVCIKCTEQLFNDFADKLHDQRAAVILLCHLQDYPFSYDLYDGAMENCFERGDARAQEDKEAIFSFGRYVRSALRRQVKNQTFSTTILTGELNKTKKDKVLSADKDANWEQSDIENRMSCIEIVGHDPFEGFPETDRKYLFNELIKYLDTDENITDSYKLSQIIQVVINNCQIRNVDLAMSTINPVVGYADIKNLATVKQSIVTANDKIAKENEISVKNRSNKDIGRNTLTFLMRDLRQKDFEAAEANYYDQLKSTGTQWAADMSLRAIKENTFFDENDYKEMGEIQYNLIKELQDKLDEAQEQYRLSVAENEKLRKLLDEEKEEAMQIKTVKKPQPQRKGGRL